STPKLTISTPSTGILFGNSNTKIYTGSGNLILRSNGNDGLRIDSGGMAYADIGFSTPKLTISTPSTGILFFADVVNEITSIGGSPGSGGSIIRTVGSNAGGSLGFFTSSKTSTIQTITETSSDPAVTELQNF